MPSQVLLRLQWKALLLGIRWLTDLWLNAPGQPASLTTKASLRGLAPSDWCFLGLAGDHPFQTKVCGSLRSHLRTEICPWCHANTSNIPFEDFARSAAWRRTVFQSVPWKSSSPFAILPGGSHPSFIKWDLMHMVPHGCACNFCASVVCMLCGPLGLISPMPGLGLRKDRCLEAATRLMDSWLIGVGKSMRDLKELTPENLQWKLNRDFPDSSCKASDCILLAQWLLDLIGTMPWQRVDFLSHCRWLMKAYRAWTTFSACATQATDCSWIQQGKFLPGMRATHFFNHYTDLAVYWNSRGWCLFGYTPKYHFTGHWDDELSGAIERGEAWAWNPGAFSTPMMEDFVGVASRISRAVHPGAVPINTIRKYLVEMRRLWWIFTEICCGGKWERRDRVWMGRKIRVLVRVIMAWVAPQIPQILMINYFWLHQLFLMIGKNQKKVIRWERAGIYIYNITMKTIVCSGPIPARPHLLAALRDRSWPLDGHMWTSLSNLFFVINGIQMDKWMIVDVNSPDIWRNRAWINMT